MVNINVKNKEVKDSCIFGDVLLLKNKIDDSFKLGIITKHNIESTETIFYDLTMFGKSDFRSASQWRVDDKYRTIEDLIKSVEKYHTITKLEEDQFEINIDVKL